jgi:hypothetical protein
MRTRVVILVVGCAILSVSVACARRQSSAPTTATWITKEEVDTVNKSSPGTDRLIKVVDIGHENFAVGIVHRGKTVNGVEETPNPGDADLETGATTTAPQSCGRKVTTPPTDGAPGGITHDSQTEGYYIVSGGGTMFTDGYIANGEYSNVPNLNGPTCGGTAYGVTKKTVKAGDIVIIPAGVVHGWLDIPEQVEYLSFRPSPGILTAGWINPALKK